MNKMNLLLCDDERDALGILRSAVYSLLQSKGIEADVRTSSTKKELLTSLATFNADVILLDIDMPGEDGISIAEEICNNYKTPIIFVSNCEDRVFESFKVHPFGFVRKSNFLLDFSNVISTFIQQKERSDSKNDRLIIKKEKSFLSIKIKDILYIECQMKHQKIYMIDEEEPLEIRYTIKELETILDEKGFLRVHKGFLVNISYIYRIDDDNVILKNGVKVPVSKRKVGEVRKEYLNKLKKTDSLLFLK